MEVTIYAAKRKLSQLVDRAMAGEDVVIAKGGKPMARLVRVDAPVKRRLGSGAGSIQYADGWDAPMTDAEFDGLTGGGV